jgi:uncharacterized protein YkwD
MNWVDGILILIVVLAMWTGWTRGFIISFIDLLVWMGSLLAGFFAYKYFGDFFQKYLPALGVWTLPLAFFIAIILARILLSMIFNKFLVTTPPHAHEHGVNQALGLLPGMVKGILYATIIAAIFLALPISDSMTNQARDSRFAGRLAVGVEWLDNKLTPIFGDAGRTTINSMTVKPGSDESVDLPFTISNAKARPDLEAQMLELVNAERTQRGLKPLAADPELTQVSRKHSNDMFSRGYFSHHTPEGKDPFDRMREDNVKFLTAGENLALGQTLKICHEGLMNSPGHKANILRPNYGRLGVGILDGGFRGLMVTQSFRN